MDKIGTKHIFLLPFGTDLGQTVSMAQMVQIQEMHNGELKVYKRQEADGSLSSFWYYEIKIPNNPRQRHKSSKLKEFSSALMFAETQYQKLKERAMMGISISAVSY